MKRIIAAIAALALALAGCGEKSKTGPGPGESKGDKPTKASDPDVIVCESWEDMWNKYQKGEIIFKGQFSVKKVQVTGKIARIEEAKGEDSNLCFDFVRGKHVAEGIAFVRSIGGRKVGDTVTVKGELREPEKTTGNPWLHNAEIVP